MGAILEAYITNLGKYAEGQLVGETLKFPTTMEEVQSLLKRIGVDGVRYEEIFITSFDIAALPWVYGNAVTALYRLLHRIWLNAVGVCTDRRAMHIYSSNILYGNPTA